MKLLRLQLIKPFRSLPERFEVHFLRERDYGQCFDFHPYCLAGLNGSGKSNLLEALAAIFYHVECINLDPDSRPEGFLSEDETNMDAPGFNARRCEPDAFELEYITPVPGRTLIVEKSRFGPKPVAHVLIAKLANERPVIRWLNRADFDSTEKSDLVREEIKALLPAFVLGYASGHNETLSLPFFKMRFIAFDEYRDKLVKKVEYPNRPEGRLIYLDDQFSQVILLCHYLFPTKAINQVFKDKVRLEGFRCFRLIIRRFHPVMLEQAIDPKRRPEDKPEATTELTTSLSRTIDKLIRCSTTHYEIPRRDENEDAVDLYLDYWLDDETCEAFALHFANESGGTDEEGKAASALNLFHAFQILLTLNVYKVDPETKRELYESASLYVNETVPTPASHERIARFKDSRLIKTDVTEKIYLKNLSDGEHQLLHTIGLCLLFRHQPALFLLDEPETHLNPDWRASYITTLRNALKADGAADVMREVLLTSHSPFIISDCRTENVLVFTKDLKKQIVTCSRPDFETFGASANAITIKVFGQTETIGDLAMSELKKFRERLDHGEDSDRLIGEANELLGDSVEKILFINEALNRKEGK
jgi:restriction system-associated AAA family ATPase